MERGVALDLMREPGRMLSAVQIGITLVGIVAGAFSGATIAERGDAWLESQDVPTRIAEPVAYVAVVVMITYLSVVLGELVPKQIGMRNAEQVAAIVARPMQILARGAAPVVISARCLGTSWIAPARPESSARQGGRHRRGNQDDDRRG